MSNEQKLLPCPFCGGEAEYIAHGDHAAIECQGCGVCTPDHIGNLGVLKNLWSTRTDTSQQQVEGKGFKKIKYLIEGIICRNPLDYSQPLIDELRYLDKQAERIKELEQQLANAKADGIEEMIYKISGEGHIVDWLDERIGDAIPVNQMIFYANQLRNKASEGE